LVPAGKATASADTLAIRRRSQECIVPLRKRSFVLTFTAYSLLLHVSYFVFPSKFVSPLIGLACALTVFFPGTGHANGEPEHRVVQLGTNQQIPLDFSFDLRQQVVWFKNGQRYEVAPYEAPYFEEVKMSDAAFYRAEVRTPIGIVKIPARQLAVADGRPGQIVSALGATSRIQAKVKGKNLTYAWFKNGAPLQNSSKHRGTASRTLSILNVEQDDVADYVCQISLGETMERAADHTLVLVNAKPEISELTLPNGRVGRYYQTVLETNIPATRYSARNLPRGLSLDPVRGEISGWPTRPGTYHITVASSNPRGRRTQKVTLIIDRLVSGAGGKFVGLANNDPSIEGLQRTGLLEAKISVSGAGSLKTSIYGSDGRLHHLRYRFSALRESSPGSDFFEAPALPVILPGGYDTLATKILIQLYAEQRKLHVELDLPLYPTGSGPPNQMNWQAGEVPWHKRSLPAVAYAGRFNWVADSNPQIDHPSGQSYAHVLIGLDGRVRLVGKTADRKPLLMSSWVTFDQKIPLHIWRHSRSGYIRVNMTFRDTPWSSEGDLYLTGWTRWFQPPSSRRGKNVYPQGFDINYQDCFATRYLPPSASNPLVMNLPAGALNLQCHLYDFNGQRSAPATVRRNHTAATERRFMPPTADIVSGIRFNPRTGFFKGTWHHRIVADSDSPSGSPLATKKYPFEGVIMSEGRGIPGTGRGFATREVLMERADAAGEPYWQRVPMTIPLFMEPSEYPDG